jgi:hypothetical protein
MKKSVLAAAFCLSFAFTVNGHGQGMEGSSRANAARSAGSSGHQAEGHSGMHQQAPRDKSGKRSNEAQDSGPTDAHADRKKVEGSDGGSTATSSGSTTGQVTGDRTGKTTSPNGGGVVRNKEP